MDSETWTGAAEAAWAGAPPEVQEGGSSGDDEGAAVVDAEYKPARLSARASRKRKASARSQHSGGSPWGALLHLLLFAACTVYCLCVDATVDATVSFGATDLTFFCLVAALTALTLVEVFLVEDGML